MSEVSDASEVSDEMVATGSLELDANLVLAAGAGAGKTHALVSVALGLYVGAGRSGLREPLEPTRVWAVTFTEKAARELRQRIVARAAALAADPEGALAEETELAAMLGDRAIPAARWKTIVEQLPAAPIGTFHSLCAQILRGFAVEAGVDPNFGVLDESAAAELFARILDEVLLRELEATDDEHSDSHTRAAARALGGPDLLRAALRRLHTKLGEEGRDPRSLLVDADGRPQPGFDRILARAQLAEACEALAQSIELLEESREDRLRPTLRALAIERGRIGDCSAHAVRRWYPAMVRVASQRRGKGTLPKRARRVWEPFAEAWERVQDCVASLEEQALGERIVALLEAVSTAYAEEKARLQVLDFVDLVRGAHDLLRDDRVVRRQIKQRVGALLVDEFQDTNGLQLDLVHLLAEARDEERVVPRGARASAALPLGARCFAAVGDRKQSIYEFRGADVSLFQGLAARARAQSDGAGLRLHALRRSWRSRPGLVEFCNELFSRLLISDDPQGFAVDWIEEVDRLEPVRDDHEDQLGLPAVQLLCSDPNEDSRTRRREEARRLAEHVRLLLDARPPLGRTGADGRPKPLRGADVAILMRTHTHVARYRRALADQGIASIVVGGRGFHGAREVRELAVLMLAIANPRDPLASAGVWRSPVWGVSDRGLVELAAADKLRLADHVTGCDVELSDPEDARVITQVARLVQRLHHELDRLGPARVLRFAVERLGLRQVLAWDDAGEQRIANVDKLLDLLGSREYAGLGAMATARRLIERGEDPLDREAPAEVAAAADPDAVRIMTVHAAKGLEFPVVVVPELGTEPRGQEGPVVFERELGLAVVSPDFVGRRRPSPHAVRIAERLAARRDAESRRLLYVAATRARDLLVLIGEAPEGRASEGNWRKLIDAAVPEFEELVEIVDVGPVIQTDEGDGSSSAMRWLLDRVARVRDAAIERRPESGEPDERPDPDPTQPSFTPSDAPPIETARRGPDPADSRAELDSAHARSEALHLRDCELEVSLSGLAEFDKCPRRYLLTHVVGLDTPAHEEREAMRGLQLLPFVPRARAEESDAGDRAPPSLAEARSRGRLVHSMLGRVALDRLGRDPERALDGFASQDHVPEGLWLELREDLLRFAARPWVRELIEIHRRDPRRVLRSLPFALEIFGEHAPPITADKPEPESTRVQLDLFAPITTESAAPPQGRVIVRGRVDLLWIDDAGRINLVDWQYAKAPPERAAILDPEDVPGFRRLIQAWAVRRLWGPRIGLRAGAVFLREDEADPALRELDLGTLARFDQRLRATAARLLEVELGEADGAVPWPKLDTPAACGGCVHVGRCWTVAAQGGDGEAEAPPP